MRYINVRNVNDGLLRGYQLIKESGVARESRYGDVLQIPEPVCIKYNKPRERVLFWKQRDANPYFHFMESLWMIAGRNDVDWISQFSSNIASFSDDGVTFHGAYGHRWKNHFNGYYFNEQGSLIGGKVDQVAQIVDQLQKDKNDRRVVLQMWDTELDLGHTGKDFPCNLVCTFQINPYGYLDMTVFNRSNDMIWGAFGANAVHFSFLQEVIACSLKIQVGSYWQISTNFHAYIKTMEKHASVTEQPIGFCPYELDNVKPLRIMDLNTTTENWYSDLYAFMEEGPIIGLKTKFFRKTVIPMYQSWLCWKEKDIDSAINYAGSISASDWKQACIQWLLRRK